MAVPRVGARAVQLRAVADRGRRAARGSLLVRQEVAALRSRTPRRAAGRGRRPSSVSRAPRRPPTTRSRRPSGSCPPPASRSWITTLSKPSADSIALQTTESTSSTEPDSSSRDETERSSVSAVCDRAQLAADWAASVRTAACDAAATSTSSSSSESRMPDAGSPTEKIPRMCPSEWRNGTKSSSSGLPGARDRALGRARDVPVAEVRAPVELPLVDHVGAAAQELRVHDRVEPFAWICRAEQRLDAPPRCRGRCRRRSRPTRGDTG